MSFLRLAWSGRNVYVTSMREAIKPLYRLNVTRTAVAAMSVFAASCMNPMQAKAKSPNAGQGLGKTTLPTQPADGINGESAAYALPSTAPSGAVAVTLQHPLVPTDVAFFRLSLQLPQAWQCTASD